MAKKGKAQHGSIEHGVEGSDKWKEDQTIISKKSRESGIKYIPVEVDKHQIFKSDTSHLRPVDSKGKDFDWGYYVAPEIYGELGVATASEFSENLQEHRKELSSYEDTSKRGGIEYKQTRKKGAGQSYLERFTMEVSPDISRGIEHAISVGSDAVESMKDKLSDLIPSITKEFENLHKGSKVVGAGWHVLSGQLHVDLWAHDFYDKEVVIGKKQKKQMIRTRDHGALCHYGSGQGIVAWQRHLKVLGDDAISVAPATVLEVSNAMKSKEVRAQGLGRGNDSNRDIRMHSFLDEAVAELVPPSDLKEGKKEYKDHLVHTYASGQAGPDLEDDKKRARVEKLAKAALGEVARRLSTPKRTIEPKNALKELDVVIEKARTFDKIKGGVIKLLKWSSKAKLPNYMQSVVTKLKSLLKVDSDPKMR